MTLYVQPSHLPSLLCCLFVTLWPPSSCTSSTQVMTNPPFWSTLITLSSCLDFLCQRSFHCAVMLHSPQGCCFGQLSLPVLAEGRSSVWADPPRLVTAFTCQRTLGYLVFLAVTGKPAVNIWLPVFCDWLYAFVFLSKIGSHVRCVFDF